MLVLSVSNPKASLNNLALSFGVSGIACVVGATAPGLLVSDFSTAGERHRINQWVTGASPLPELGAWQAAKLAVDQAVARDPQNPDLLAAQADALTVSGQMAWTDLSASTVAFGQAALAYERAASLRPQDAGIWAMLALTRQLSGSAKSLQHDAWAKALGLGPTESHVIPVLWQVVLSDWATASPQMQAWAKASFDAADAATQAAINQQAKPFGIQFIPDAPQATPKSG